MQRFVSLRLHGPQLSYYLLQQVGALAQRHRYLALPRVVRPALSCARSEQRADQVLVREQSQLVLVQHLESLDDLFVRHTHTQGFECTTQLPVGDESWLLEAELVQRAAQGRGQVRAIPGVHCYLHLLPYAPHQRREAPATRRTRGLVLVVRRGAAVALALVAICRGRGAATATLALLIVVRRGGRGRDGAAATARLTPHEVSVVHSEDAQVDTQRAEERGLVHRAPGQHAHAPKHRARLGVGQREAQTLHPVHECRYVQSALQVPVEPGEHLAARVAHLQLLFHAALQARPAVRLRGLGGPAGRYCFVCESLADSEVEVVEVVQPLLVQLLAAQEAEEAVQVEVLVVLHVEAQHQPNGVRVRQLDGAVAHGAQELCGGDKARGVGVLLVQSVDDLLLRHARAGDGSSQLPDNI
mmetsp:Transcript_19764/g.44054  ORF Transcript_19764/g.44054 Transcript_19764/m.44054 type:complete len:414 (-) Transcript_19764:2669-3910(-)